MKHSQKLLDSGYQKQDLLDLCEIFDQQIQHFLELYQTFDSKSLADQIHRLVGGCRLLQITDVAEQLTVIEKHIRADLQVRENELSKIQVNISNVLNDLKQTSILLQKEINSL